MKCLLSIVVSAFCTLTAFADGTVLGRFQPPASVARQVLPLAGQVKFALTAEKAIDLSTETTADLRLAFDLRVTRHDRARGPKALAFVRNGSVILADETGREVFKAGSPVQHGVAPLLRQAEEWMNVSLPLGNLKADAGRIKTLLVSDYNDTPKEKDGARTGIDVELRNARLVRLDEDDRALAAKMRAVEAKTPRTVCNPIDLEYMIQRGKRQPNGRLSDVFYESADPALVVYKGEYWLFASHGEGYWVSKDLADWEFIRVDVTDPVLSAFKVYAPATCVVDGVLYVTHSGVCPILKTTNPRDPTSWEIAAKPQGWSDPGMLYDDPATGGDGFVYLYKGLTHFEAIQSVRLDPKKGMTKVDDRKFDCCWPDQLNRGFEVPGDFCDRYGAKDTMEGSWPVKANGRYYLTCAVPGTEFASYCDNCFVGPSPLGPFVLTKNNPCVWKSTGYTQGAGHGCVFQDLNGNWWKVDTCRLTGFNRRLVLLPALFDDDGELYTNTVMSDYPSYIPGTAKDPFNEPGPGWGLLSYGKRTFASSNPGSAGLAVDENMATCWIPATDEAGEWLMIDLGKTYGVRSVQVNFTDVDPTEGGRDNDWAYRYLLEFSQDAKAWRTLVDRTKAMVCRPHEYVEFADAVGARYVRLTNRGTIPGHAKLAVNALRVFGEGRDAKPAAVAIGTVKAERLKDNNRTAIVSWPKAEGAQGYIVRYGFRPDRLHTHYQVWDTETVTMNSLVRGNDVYLTVDSFNESGVTRGTETIHLPATEPLVDGYDIKGDNPAFVNRVKDVPLYEAEKAVSKGSAVAVRYEVRASGARAVEGFGAVGSSVTFTAVSAARVGSGVLRLSYATPFPAKVGLVVNGVRQPPLALPATPGWPTFKTIDVPVAGLKKSNTICIEGLGDQVGLDWLQLLPDEAK